MNPISFGAEYLEAAESVTAGRTRMATIWDLSTDQTVEDDLLPTWYR